MIDPTMAALLGEHLMRLWQRQSSRQSPGRLFTLKTRTGGALPSWCRIGWRPKRGKLSDDPGDESCSA